MRCGFSHETTAQNKTKIEIRNLTMAYGSFVVMRDINARVSGREKCLLSWAGPEAARAASSST